MNRLEKLNGLEEIMEAPNAVNLVYSSRRANPNTVKIFYTIRRAKLYEMFCAAPFLKLLWQNQLIKTAHVWLDVLAAK